MGSGIDAARPHAPEHAALLDDLKDQLLLVLIKRLADEDGKLELPVGEVDATGGWLLALAVDMEARVFRFQLSKKQ